jgi:hypothetical protein
VVLRSRTALSIGAGSFPSEILWQFPRSPFYRQYFVKEVSLSRKLLRRQPMLRKWILLVAAGLMMGIGSDVAQATDWGRFYHYPYSYYPQNYRRPFRSKDFDTRFGYPFYPQYMAFPPYFRKDLYYQYHRHMKPGGSVDSHWQGNHYILDVF